MMKQKWNHDKGRIPGTNGPAFIAETNTAFYKPQGMAKPKQGFVLADALAGLVVLSLMAVWTTASLRVLSHTARRIRQRYELIWALDNTLTELLNKRFVRPGEIWQPDAGMPSVTVTVTVGAKRLNPDGPLILYPVEARACHHRDSKHCVTMKTLMPLGRPQEKGSSGPKRS